MQSNRVLGLFTRNNLLFVAVSDPTNIHALDSVQFQMGMNVSPIVVEDDKLGRLIEKSLNPVIQVSNLSTSMTGILVLQKITLPLRMRRLSRMWMMHR